MNTPHVSAVQGKEVCSQRHDGKRDHHCKLDVGHVGDHACFWSSCGKTWARSDSDSCAPQMEFPRFVDGELYKRQYPTQSPAEAALDYLAAIFRSHTRSNPEQREVAAAAIQDYFDWKARQPKNADTPTSHLRNAQQILVGLSSRVGDVEFMDVDQTCIEDLRKTFLAVDARIRAALEQLEGKSR